MKRITAIALALVVLCLACAEIKDSQIPQFDTASATATEAARKATVSDAKPKEVMTEETEPQSATPEESPIVESETVCEQITTAQKEDTPEETDHAKTDGADDIPVVIEHAKTGYGDEEPEISPQPAPEPEPLADIQVAIDTACAYAANTYGVIIDTSLDFDNSAYRFPAVVPDTASQEALNAKAIDMVDYTFKQQMVLNQVTVEQIRNAEFHCNIAIEAENGEWYTYVFYAG